jgi:hypothetical protein
MAEKDLNELFFDNERRADCSQTDAVEHRSAGSPARRLLVGVAT